MCGGESKKWRPLGGKERSGKAGKANSQNMFLLLCSCRSLIQTAVRLLDLFINRTGAGNGRENDLGCE